MVKVGKNDLGGDSDGLPGEDIPIEKITVHPDYKRKTKLNDIALLKLARRPKMTNFVMPACLYLKETNPNEPLIITGWGKVAVDGGTSSLLQKATISTITIEKCNTDFQPLNRSITTKQICAFSNEGKDTCQGDSGGPLQLQLSTESNIYSIVGVTSFGIGCGGATAGVYTRVASYLDWIESIVWV